MIPNSIKEITNALDAVFPANLFLVSETGKIRWANQRLLECSGFSNIKAIKGKHVSLFGEQEWRRTQRVAASQQTETAYENHQGKDFITLKTPFTQGGFRGVIGLSFDITALKQAEKAKEEFFLNMAHDIRTPLAGIIGTLEMLDEEEVDLKTKKRLADCLQASQQLLAFLQDAHEISQTHQMLDYKSCNIRALLDDTLLLFNAAAQLKCLSIEIDCKIIDVITDRFRLQKILINFLSNAIKYTEQGRITVAIITTKANLIISVSDTGIGIDDAHQTKIFEKGFQVTPAYQQQEYSGIGKGLYLVKRYVLELGGTVHCKSQLGKGSTFTVDISLQKINPDRKYNRSKYDV